MSGVRVLVGTRKGAFVLTSDERREKWDVERAALRRVGDLPHEGITQRTPTGSTRHRPRPGSGRSSSARTMAARRGRRPGNEFSYDGVPGTHQWYDGTPHPWEFARVWHLEPSLTDADTVFAGVEDAALFKSTDGGASVEGALGPARAQHGRVVAAGRGRDVPAHDHPGPEERGSHVRRDLVGGRVPDRRRRRDLEADQQGPALGGHARPGRARSATACTASRSTRRGRTRCSCRSTGT